MTYVAAAAVAVLELVRLVLDFHEQRLSSDKKSVPNNEGRIFLVSKDVLIVYRLSMLTVFSARPR